MKSRASAAMRLRVASSNSETEFIMMFEWNCSRLVKEVCRATIPMAPPRLRITLNRAEAEPAFSPSIPAVATAESGAKQRAWPRARTTFGHRSCGAAVSLVMWMFMKLLAANKAKPAAITSLGSYRLISRGTKGINRSCGKPVQASTKPICSEL